jgi:hypothetical protein
VAYGEAPLGWLRGLHLKEQSHPALQAVPMVSPPWTSPISNAPASPEYHRLAVVCLLRCAWRSTAPTALLSTCCYGLASCWVGRCATRALLPWSVDSCWSSWCLFCCSFDHHHGYPIEHLENEEQCGVLLLLHASVPHGALGCLRPWALGSPMQIP